MTEEDNKQVTVIEAERHATKIADHDLARLATELYGLFYSELGQERVREIIRERAKKL